jgi:hypothetical protein
MALSAPLLWKKRVIKVKLEANMGTKVSTDQAILVSNLKINPTAPFIERGGTGLYRGHDVKGVIGAQSGKCTFSVEMRGTGSGGCELGLAILLQACGLIKSSEAYTVHSVHSSDKTISIDVWEDGKLKGLAGASGTFTFHFLAGQRVVLDFDFDGIWQAPTADALPTWTPSTVLPFMGKSGTFTLDSNAIKISKFDLDIGSKVVPREDVCAVSGIAYYMVADILPMASFDPEADLVAGYDYHGIWLASTEKVIAVVAKNSTDKCTIAIPKFQTRELPEGERNGIMIHEISGQCDHSSGNDAVSLTFAAA